MNFIDEWSEYYFDKITAFEADSVVLSLNYKSDNFLIVNIFLHILK